MNKLTSKIPPSIIAFLLQTSAFLFSWFGLPVIGVHPDLIEFAFISGTLAAIFSYFAGLAIWWLIIQFIFLPAALTIQALNIHPLIFLGLFTLMLLVYWSTFRSQVPLYLSSNKVWLELEKLLPPAKKQQPFRFIDLGSGLGGVLTHLALARPDGNYVGVELAPLPFFWSWLRIRLGAFNNCQVQRSSFWDCNLADYDVVFAYLSPVPMVQLWSKAQAEMRPGTVFISSTFAVPGQKPKKTIKVNDLHQSTLLVWQM